MIKIDTINQYKALEQIKLYYVIELIQVELYDGTAKKVIDEDGQEVIYRWTGENLIIE